jgi:hypothetical protein
MKRTGLFYVAVLVASAWTTAHAADGVSRPVGVLKAELQPGESRAVSIPFWPLGDCGVNAVLQGQLTGHTNESAADLILKWDSAAATPGYVRAFKADGTGDAAKDGNWFQDFSTWRLSAISLAPGEGFFLINRQGYTQQVILAGEVALEPEIECVFPAGLNLLGPPFVGSIRPEATGLVAGRLQSGTLALPGSGPISELLPGSAYWLRVVDSPFAWRVSRPYANPFPASDAPPRVTAITLDGTKVLLTIATAGLTGATLDVYFQDLGPSNTLVAEGAWSVAALDLDVGQEIVWSDDLAGLGEVARVYLIATSQDLDADGIPDARRHFLAPGELARAMANYSRLKGRGLIARRNLEGAAPSAPAANPAPGRGPLVFVHPQGNDAHSGRIAVFVVGDGPKRTVRAGLSEAGPGDTLVIRAGRYGEPLDARGRGIAIRIEGPVDLTQRR